MHRQSYPGNEFCEPCASLLSMEDDGAPRGRVVRFDYETRNHREEDGRTYQKSALVYLPAGYDETKAYDVLYLMHGGGDSPAWFLGGEGSGSPITRMIDRMIDSGELQPLLVCALSYYTEYCGDATENCRSFPLELTRDVMPAFETKYRTHALSADAAGFAASREHRAFGGFSMGGLTTWSVFENCLADFAYFVPMSGDCWEYGVKGGGSHPRETADYLAERVLAGGWTKDDFKIYAGCGDRDIAHPNLTPQIEAMKERGDVFVMAENFADGNLWHCVCENGWHDVHTVTRILYNALPKLFG